MAFGVAAPDAPLRELFERIAPHADLAHPNLAAIGDALSALSADHDYLAPEISDMGDVSGTIRLHVPERGPRLLLVHRREGQMSAVHDHGHLVGRGDAAYVLILLGDDQFRYRRSEWDPASGRRRTLEPGDRGRWLAGEPFPASGPSAA